VGSEVSGDRFYFFPKGRSFKSSDLNAIYTRLLTSGFIYGANPKYS